MVVLTREQLENRISALHRASLELVSELSSHTLLERIVQTARQQVDARYAALGVLDDSGDLIQFIPVGMTHEQIEQVPHFPVGKGLLGLIREKGETIRIPEILDDPHSVGFPENHPEMHSFLGVPIFLGDRLLGTLYLTDKMNYSEFTEQDERVIETLAAYAAVAINNSRMYEVLLVRDRELSQRNEDLRLLNEVATDLTGSYDVDEILEKTIRLVMDYLELDAGEIYLREDGENNLQLALHRGDFPETFSFRDHFRVGQGYFGKVAESGKGIVSDLPNEEIRYLRPSLINSGYQNMACIPITTGVTTVGIMVVVSRMKNHIDERKLSLLSSIGNWVGITIENARLNRQARRLAVLEERERIGMDLHDGIIQSIYGVGLSLDYVRMALKENPEHARTKIEESIDDLNKTIRDIRAYILDLKPRQYHGDDLKQGLQRLVEEFQNNSGTAVNLVGPENGLVDFPAPNATALFHICQEGLANIAKHAQAKNAEVNLWIARDRVLLEITDDGQGFDLRKMSVTLGHGLSNMHFRAHKVGGGVEITSNPNHGTTILAWVPRWVS